MAEMKFTLPGSETVTLTGQTIDKLIRVGDGDAALLYLYILKTQGRSTSSEAAIALDKSKGWIASAMAVLSRLGLVHLDDDLDTKTGSAGASVHPPEPPSEQQRQFTESEVAHEILTGTDFSVVVDETQRRLGKQLSSDELLRLFGIYETLRLPPEVILQLITHCINESRITGDGRAPSIRYIEKAAYTWEREGLFTLERAEEYLKGLEARKSIRGEIKIALQIRGREFSATEKRYVDDWISMGFDAEAIAIAYDRTVIKTGKLTWKYIDSIINNWHSKGLHSAQQILEKDGWQKRNEANQAAWAGANKRGEPSREEMDRMQKLLNKIKEE